MIQIAFSSESISEMLIRCSWSFVVSHGQDALKALKSGRLPPPGALPSFSEIKDVVGIQEYYEEDERYASLQIPTSSTAQKGTPGQLSVSPDPSKFASLRNVFHVRR